MQLRGKERTVSADVLRDLLVGGRWPVHAKGVRIRGVRISGLLDLEGATLRCPLSLDSCYFDGAVRLDHVTASRIVLTGCQLAGLTASMLTARQIDLSRSTLRTGPLLLMCADITGDLICSGAQLNGTDSDHNALVAGGMKVGGSVYLDQLDDPFTATGAVWLARADITGDLACSGAQLGRNGDGIGLLADGIRVGGEVFLREGFTAAGSVRLLGADITGDLSCRDAQLGHDHDGNALVADRMKVGGEVHLYKGFTADGAVVLKGADITGDLSFRGAKLNGKNRDGNALDADGMKAGHDVLLDNEPGDEGPERPFTAAGAVRLARADITGQLRCSGAQLTGTRHAPATPWSATRSRSAPLCSSMRGSLPQEPYRSTPRALTCCGGRPTGNSPGRSTWRTPTSASWRITGRKRASKRASNPPTGTGLSVDGFALTASPMTALGKQK